MSVIPGRWGERSVAWEVIEDCHTTSDPSQTVVTQEGSADGKHLFKKFNTKQYKYEYYYSGVTPLSFEENSILKLFFIFEEMNFIRSQSQWSSNQIYGTR